MVFYYCIRARFNIMLHNCDIFINSIYKPCVVAICAVVISAVLVMIVVNVAAGDDINTVVPVTAVDPGVELVTLDAVEPGVDAVVWLVIVLTGRLVQVFSATITALLKQTYSKQPSCQVSPGCKISIEHINQGTSDIISIRHHSGITNEAATFT